MSLLAAVLTLTPTRPTGPLPYLGRATHAWFLDRVLAHDHRLAAALHEPNQERPFTVSDVRGGGRRAEGGGRRVEAGSAPAAASAPEGGQRLWLRLTSYEPQLTALLAERILPDLPALLRLGDAEFRILGGTTDAAVHPWAGRTSFEALTAQCTLQEPMPNWTALQFASPTVFKSHEQFLPFPLPRLVFEGLARRWNAFSPVQIHPEVARYAEECMAISRYRLHTAAMSLGGETGRGNLPGCLGECAYALRVQDRYWMGLIHLLAAFAFYAGVGKQTTMGMGQARPVRG